MISNATVASNNAVVFTANYILYQGEECDIAIYHEVRDEE